MPTEYVPSIIATEIDTDTEYDSSESSVSFVQGSDYPDDDVVIVYDPRL